MFDVTHKQSQCNSLDVGLYVPLYSERRPRSSNETMVNKCALEYCRTGKDQSTGDTKKSVFKFPLEDTEICEKWTYFVGKKDWRPSKYSVICEDHFDQRYIKVGEERNKLNFKLRPVPTIHTNDEKTPMSVLRVPKLPRPTPKCQY